MNPPDFRNYFFWLIASTLVVSATGATAQDRLLAEFPIDVDARPYSIEIEGCDYKRPSIFGSGLIFECTVQPSFKVTLGRDRDDNVLVRFAIMELRQGASVTAFNARPLYQLRASFEDQAAAEDAFDALPNVLKPAASTAAAAAVQPEPVQEAPAEAPVTEEPSSEFLVKLQWPKGVGALQLIDGTPVNLVSEDEINAYGELMMPDPAGMVEIRSVRNPVCSVRAPYSTEASATPVIFQCKAIELAPPFAAESLSGPGCERTDAGGLNCLHPLVEARMQLTAVGWQNMVVSVAPDGTTSDLGPKDFVPAVSLGSLAQPLTQAGASACGAEAAVRFEFLGYCSGDTCHDFAGENRSLLGQVRLPDLATAGWDQPELPVAFSVGIARTEAGAEVELTEATFNLSHDPQAAMEEFVAQALRTQTVPLTVALERSQYRFGRQLRLYTDTACQTPFEGQTMDLSNPGNREPDVPQCSFFQIYDEGKVRSKCTQIAYDPASSSATATLPGEACGQQRVVMVVAESSSLNGRAGNAIVSSLRELTQEMNAAESCLQVDVVRSRGDRRETLLKAEDIYFTQNFAELDRKIRMDFVNTSSEVLRDFDWVYRTWGDDLAGVIFVGDADQVRVSDMIESPAAMAWKIKEVGTSALVFGAPEGCSVFSDTLLFSDCVQADFDGFKGQLAAMVQDGLAAAIRDR